MQSPASLLRPLAQSLLRPRTFSNLPSRLRLPSRALPSQSLPAIRWGIRAHSTGPVVPPVSIGAPGKSEGDEEVINVDMSSGRGQIGKIEPKLSLTFTCTADDCGQRSSHEFAKKSYEKGIVLVQCPKCKNRHLIADHLSWFSESTENGRLPRIEDILKARGEVVRKGRGVGVEREDGTVEYILEEEEAR